MEDIVLIGGDVVRLVDCVCVCVCVCVLWCWRQVLRSVWIFLPSVGGQDGEGEEHGHGDAVCVLMVRRCHCGKWIKCIRIIHTS